MTLRISAVLFLAALATGCSWEGRPDGASANHSTVDGFDDEAMAADPVYGIGTEAEVIEPLEGAGDVPAAGATEAPVDLTQPAPTTGTADATSEVEEALTPGTEQ